MLKGNYIEMYSEKRRGLDIESVGKDTLFIGMVLLSPCPPFL